MRALLTSPTSPGLLYPTLALGQELLRRGHDVMLATGTSAAERVRAAGLRLAPTPASGDCGCDPGRWYKTDEVISQAGYVSSAVRSFHPQLVVGHPLTLGTYVAAELHGLPLAVLGLLVRLFPDPDCDDPQSAAEQEQHWRLGEFTRFLNAARQILALPALAPDARNFDGTLHLLRSVPELDGAHRYPHAVHYVGALLGRPARDPELETWLATCPSDRQLIYVQPSRSFGRRNFIDAACAAFDDDAVRVVVDYARCDQPPAQWPKNFFASSSIPQHAVLPRAAAVIASGHTTTVLGALSHGRPLCLLPNGSATDDIAQRCERAGAATVLNVDQVDARALRTALDGMLTRDAPQAAAQRLARAFARVDSVPRAVDLLESVCAEAGVRTLSQPAVSTC